MTTTHKTFLTLAICLTVFALGLMFSAGIQKPVYGSVGYGSEYHSTTTRAYPGSSLTDPTVLCSGPGTLGSIVITGANTSIINFYDGTTTGPHSDRATTTIATIPASTVAGTYTFDASAFTGLIYDQDGGNLASSTITYRCAQ